MLWELSVTEQRYRAVLEVLAGVPVTEVADRYGVSESFFILGGLMLLLCLLLALIIRRVAQVRSPALSDRRAR